MSINLFNPLALLIGFLAGIGSVVALIGRLERSGDSRYFYRSLLLVIFLIGAAIMLGSGSG